MDQKNERHPGGGGAAADRAKTERAKCSGGGRPDQAAEGRGGGKPSQADILIAAAAEAELFHAPDGTAYADLEIAGRRETWPVRGKGFRRWLARRYFETTERAPGSEALQAALMLIEARAHFDAPERPVHVRVAALAPRIYLDLGDASWRAVEIDAAGWRVVDRPPVRFRRAAGMQALPVPIRGGRIERLRDSVNAARAGDFILAVAWILAALRPCGPDPPRVLGGEKG